MSASLLNRRHLLAAALLPAAPARATERLVLTGSSTIAPLVLEMAKRFENLQPGVRIDVQSGGSSRGVVDVRSGAAQVGMVSRALKADESDLAAHMVALDGICLIVHRRNPIAALQDAQVKAIFTGRIRDWSELGGAGRTISVVNKAEGRSTLELFLAHFGLRNSEIRPAVVIGDNAQGIKTVAANPGAIGYVSIGAAAVEAGLGTPIRLLPMAGVAATVGELRAGRFALARPLNLVTRGTPTPVARRFIAFARSAAVRDLVEALSFVSPLPA